MEEFKKFKALAIMGIVSFPQLPFNCQIRKNASKDLVLDALDKKEKIVVVTQITNALSDDFLACVNPIGCLCNIQEVKYDRNGSGAISLVAQGLQRVKLVEQVKGEKFTNVSVEPIIPTNTKTPTTALLLSSAKERMVEFSSINNKINGEALRALSQIDDANVFVDYSSALALVDEKKSLEILNIIDTEERLEKLIGFLLEEIEIANINKKLSSKVRENMDKSQKEYYLREQMRAISDELGEEQNIFDEMEQKVKNGKMNEEVKTKVLKDINRLKKLPNASPDYSIISNYLDTCLELPWGVFTEDNKDLKRAKEILDEDHAGLEKVKERIVENLAVMQLTGKVTGQIICFVGPPGVGKTSIAKSIARALDRKFVKMSVGGVKDESEIRGHRKTYVGAMPGRIIYNMSLAGSMNPVFLIDEIDKMSADYKGDPTSALLEVLDPEQNTTFRDHFLEVPFDLSNVLFIATANNLQDIPTPLLDRMEVIELSSYTTNEKFKIAKEYLLPKEIEKHGFKSSQLNITDKALLAIIDEYTYEAGVRGLEREIAQICRKTAVEIVNSVDHDAVTINIDEKDLHKYLGGHKVIKDEKREMPEIGVVSGLSYSTVGGGVLSIEVNTVEGDGKIILTGRLGDVMQESAKAALSAVIGISQEYGIEPSIFRKKDIHIHVPEGAVKKDGPSAGSALATAIFSAFINKPVDNNLAMTGEITIRGNVLAIGGLKEKLFACVRTGIEKVIVPLQNQDDIEDLPKDITDHLKIVYVKNLREVLSEAILGLKE